MRFITLFAALAAAATAQSLSSVSSSDTITESTSLPTASSVASNSTNAPVTHTVGVAKGAHSFSPDVTQAEVGDIIEFRFYPRNHSVIQAAYGYPCVPIGMIEGPSHAGFWSGWMPVDVVLDDPPTYSVEVNNTDPIFFYCGAPDSCTGWEMVGVINPNASMSLQRQKQLAGESSFVLVPGEDWPSEGSMPSGVSSSTTAPSPTSVSSTSTSPAPSESKEILSPGAIAGIAIGGAAVLLAAGVAIWWCGRQSRKPQQQPGAPAQEVDSYAPVAGGMYAKPGHISTVSGYSMPPQYDQHGMISPPLPQSTTPVDPMMMGHQTPLIHSGMSSPNLYPAQPSPVYGQNHLASMYTVGTHNVPPVEMSSEPTRGSTEKPVGGVERYS